MNLKNSSMQKKEINIERKSTDILLKERALRLAKKPSLPTQTHCLEVVEFKIEEEHYGIEIGFVTKIQFLRDLAFIPALPSFIPGVINVHSIIVPVIDLRLLFDFEKQSFSKAEFVAVIKTETAVFGILANDILDVVQIPIDQIQPGLPTLTGYRENFIKGVSNDQIVILDPLTISTDERIVIDVNAKS